MAETKKYKVQLRGGCTAIVWKYEEALGIWHWLGQIEFPLSDKEIHAEPKCSICDMWMKNGEWDDRFEAKHRFDIIKGLPA